MIMSKKKKFKCKFRADFSLKMPHIREDQLKQIAPYKNGVEVSDTANKF